MATSIASGLGATLGFAAETTVGTYTTPQTWLPFTKESLALKKKTVQGKGLYGGMYLRGDRRAMTSHTVDGAIDFDVPDRGMGKLLAQALGSNVTPVQIGTTGVYAQVHTPGDTTGKSLSVQVGRPETNGTVVPFSYNGCKVTDWELAVAKDGLLTSNFTMDGWNEVTTQSYAAPSYVSSNPLHFAEAAVLLGGTVATPATTIGSASNALSLPQATITVASTTGFPTSGVLFVTTGAGVQTCYYTGTTSTTFTGVTGGTGSMSTGGTVSAPTAVTGATSLPVATSINIKGSNKLATDRIFLGSGGTKAEQLTNDFRDLTGEVDMEFENLTDVYTAFAADTPVALQFTVTGPNVATSGSQNSGLQVLIPQIRWEGGPPNVDGPAVLAVKAPFTAFFDGSDPALVVTYLSLDPAL